MLNRLEYRVPFSETDAMGIVHHANYPLYFERGRVELLRELGRPYAELVERGLHFPVLSMNLEYRKPARFDDILIIKTHVGEISKTRLRFDYKIHSNPNDTLLVQGSTEHCCVNETLRPVAIPTEEFTLLSKALEKI